MTTVTLLVHSWRVNDNNCDNDDKTDCFGVYMRCKPVEMEGNEAYKTTVNTNALLQILMLLEPNLQMSP